MTGLADALDGNFVVHASWIPRRWRDATVDIRADLVVVDSGIPCDTFNFVCRARLGADAAARVDEAIGHFRRAGRPFSWWVGPADQPAKLGRLLESRGLVPAESELAMAADLTALPPGGTPAALRIVRARDAAAVADFARVNAANWSPPDPEVVRFYERAAASLVEPDCPQRLYVGYVDGAAVAAAECTVADGVAGLYGISTLEAWRGRGFGSALTRRPLEDARAEGLRTAVLQAAPDGVGIYRRLGFGEIGRITEYKPG